MALKEKICLIIPCFDEEDRLALEKFALFDRDVRFVFVNDGSTDGTAKLISRCNSDHCLLLDLPKNVGKAEAVRQGFIYARSLPFYSELDWVGYWDADLSTPLSEIEVMLNFTKLYPEPADGILGSRVYRLGSLIKRSPLRHYLGRFFATVVGVLIGIESYDSQCGAKLFRRAVAEKAFGEPFVSKWVFDVEILLRLAGARLIECPLQHWEDVPGSKLKIGREAWRIWRDILKVRAAYKEQRFFLAARKPPHARLA